MTENTETFASDSEGLHRAAAALQESGGGSPPVETTEIAVLDHEALPAEKDQAGNERGISIKKAASELSKYHRRLAEERDAFEAATQQGANADETQAIALQAEADNLDAALAAMEVPELRDVIAGYPDEAMRIAASKVLEERLGNYEASLKALWDYQARVGAGNMLQEQQQEDAHIAWAAEMAKQGLLARHGLRSLEELELLRAQDPQRHAVIVGEAAQLDQQLAHAVRELRARQQAALQTIGAANALAFHNFAAEQDKKFDEANPDIAKDPAKQKQVTEDAMAYLREGGLEDQQIAQLYQTQPWFRDAVTQQALLDASRYRKAMKGMKAGKVEKPVPPVLRPGSPAARITASEAGVAEADQAFRDNPKSLRAAARLLGARRRAASR